MVTIFTCVVNATSLNQYLLMMLKLKFLREVIQMTILYQPTACTLIPETIYVKTIPKYVL